MHFNDYLKACRESNGYTQEKLVEELYQYDIDSFQGLDTNMLSKWERSVTKPSLSKQVKILKFFQNLSGVAVPCQEKETVREVEALICEVGMHNLLGKSKALVLNFPSNIIGYDELKVKQLRNIENIESILEINVTLDKDFNQNFTELDTKNFHTWALHPSNAFYVCEFKNQFFGLLFTLRLKPEIFEKIMNFEMDEKDICDEHFASYDEVGTSYILSFFAMNDKAASMLFIRYYAYLIAHQKRISDVGVGTMMEDAKKLIRNMNLKYYKSLILKNDLKLQMYKETLANFLASEPVLKMIFSKQECPEE